MHRFIVLIVACLVVAWLVGGFFRAIVFVVLGNARPLLLSPCVTHSSHDIMLNLSPRIHLLNPASWYIQCSAEN